MDGIGCVPARPWVDVTAARMPTLRIRISWELELVDVDNDRDLE